MKTIVVTSLLLALLAGGALAAPKKPAAAAPQRIALKVTSQGFEPAELAVRAGRPVVLTVTRTTDRTCAKEIVFADAHLHRELPLNRPVTLTFTPKKAGTMRYACGMNMLTGAITVQ